MRESLVFVNVFPMKTNKGRCSYVLFLQQRLLVVYQKPTVDLSFDDFFSSRSWVGEEGRGEKFCSTNDRIVHESINDLYAVYNYFFNHDDFCGVLFLK